MKLLHPPFHHPVRNSTVFVFAICICGSFSGSTTSAAIVTQIVQGEVTIVGGFTSSPFVVGDPYQAMITFDTNAVDQDPNSNVGFYEAIDNFTFSIGSYNGTGGSSFMQTRLNDAGNGDVFVAYTPGWVGNDVAGQSPSTTTFSLLVQLRDPTAMALTDDSLPGQIPGLNEFQFADFQFNFDGGGFVIGNVTSVPEPSSIALCYVAFAVFSCRRRHKRKNSPIRQIAESTHQASDIS